MPDANKENTLNQLVGAAFGAAGQRCMALSTAILVGEARTWLPDLVERAKALRVNAGTSILLPCAPASPVPWVWSCGGHPCRPNHTSRLLPCFNFTLVSAGILHLLSQPCCKFVARSAAWAKTVV